MEVFFFFSWKYTQTSNNVVDRVAAGQFAEVCRGASSTSGGFTNAARLYILGCWA